MFENANGGLSIVAALQGANLYRDGGKIPAEVLRTIQPNGEEATHQMSEIDYSDLKVFADELDIAMKHENPFVQALLAKNAVFMTQLIRGVNFNTRSGYRGSVGSGQALQALLLRAEQFGDPDQANSATLRATWVRAVAAASSLQFIIAQDALGANVHGPLTMAANEAMAIFGFANPAAQPITSAYQVQYLATNKNVQNLSFELVNNEYGEALVELMQPLVIWPGENGMITVRYNQNGSDELRPIGIWIKTSQNCRALATS